VSTANATTPPPTPLYAAEGPIVVDACEAILKGVLESQVEVGAIAAPPSPRLAGFTRALLAEANQKLLSRHQTEVLIGGDGARAVALALATVRSGRSGVAVVPSGDLVFAVEALREARSQFRDPEHGLAVILEDDPAGEPMLCPRRIAIGAGLAVVEPPDLSSLRDAIEHALRLSRAGVAPVAIVVHASLLSSIETIFVRPNRIVSNVDELILQRRLRAGSRTADAGDLLRVARRLELNAIASLPSPGEREVVGFIAIGVCERALAHVLEELTLAGRVPVLRVGLVSPVDEAPLQRLLDRVQQVVVLEPRPGVAAGGVLATVESPRVSRLCLNRTTGAAHRSSFARRSISCMPFDRRLRSRPGSRDPMRRCSRSSYQHATRLSALVLRSAAYSSCSSSSTRSCARGRSPSTASHPYRAASPLMRSLRAATRRASSPSRSSRADASCARDRRRSGSPRATRSSDC